MVVKLCCRTRAGEQHLHDVPRTGLSDLPRKLGGEVVERPRRWPDVVEETRPPDGEPPLERDVVHTRLGPVRRRAGGNQFHEGGPALSLGNGAHQLAPSKSLRKFNRKGGRIGFDGRGRPSRTAVELVSNLREQKRSHHDRGMGSTEEYAEVNPLCPGSLRSGVDMVSRGKVVCDVWVEGVPAGKVLRSARRADLGWF
jgi:hypothetical protein